MDELIYGVWNGRVHDYRRDFGHPTSDDVPVGALQSFNPGNPVTGFAGPQGFLVFDLRVTLAEVLYSYYRKARRLSCGRCTPCRAGTVLIAEALEKACNGEGESVDWAYVREVAALMAESSLCGIGLTTPAPILGAIDHFLDDLRHAPAVPRGTRDHYEVATAPCIEACPAHVEVPRYIDYIRDGHPELATAVLLEHYPLVGSCGRVCVRPCEKACVRGRVDAPVAIKDLKRFASDHAGEAVVDFFEKAPSRDLPSPLAPSVAVVGAGPAGLNCAYHLLRRGVRVDVFEKEDHAGGMARLGIPAYRLPNRFLETETDAVARLGGRVHYGMALGRDFSIGDLFRRGYRAVFLGLGCPEGQYLGLEGEATDAKGYLKGLDFLLDLERAQDEGRSMPLKGDVVVVGCGNVAMDCCRSARRLLEGTGARVVVSYRRTRESAPADPEEIEAALEEGIDFEFLTAPVEVVVEAGEVVGLKLVRMTEGEPDASGRRSVRPIPGSEFVIPCSTVVAAIGQKTDPSVFTPEDGIRFTRRGTIEVDASLATSRDGVFAGGDAAIGPTSLIRGLEEGETAAASIHEYLLTGVPGFLARRRMSEMLREGKLLDAEPPEPAPATQPRAEIRHLDASERVKGWDEVELGLDPDEALEEAKRCMRCYRLFSLTTLRPIPGKSALEEH